MNESKPARSWRRALPRWAQLVVLTVVFAAGGVIGAVVSLRTVQSRIQHYREHPEQLPDEVVPRIQRWLSLTEEQLEIVGAVFRHRHAKIVELHGHVADEIHGEFDQLEREVGDSLTTEQKAAWSVIAARIRATFLPFRHDAGDV